MAELGDEERAAAAEPAADSIADSTADACAVDDPDCVA
jgi:hypothetical protein